MTNRIWLLIMMLAFTANAAAIDVRMPKIEPYYEDDIARITPPPGDGLAAFVIPTFRGKLRLGAANEYRTQTHAQDPAVYPTLTNRKEGIANKLKGQNIYLSLLAFAEHRPRIAVAALRDAFLSGGNASTARYVDFNGDWPTHLHFLGLALTNDAEFRRLYCSEGVPCAADIMGGMRPYVAVGQLAVPFWGGGKNEFRARASYREFAETYTARLWAWGEALDRKIYVVAPLYMSDHSSYRFDRGGYVFRITSPLPFATQHARRTIKTASHTISFDPPASTTASAAYIEIFIPMDADRGEAVLQQLRAKARERLFAVYPARLTRAIRSQGQQYPTHRLNIELEHVIDGDQIEFFFGEDLKEPYMRFALR